MNLQYRKNIEPFVEREFNLAEEARLQGRFEQEFSHLETAHVLGQTSTVLHTKAHWMMWLWAVRQKNLRELVGQALRIVGALTKTVFGLVPVGNTGGANVSPFCVMAIRPEHQQLIDRANNLH
tara:strand:+ start:5902 stop:6270 length:369 start_codon:yes stop_codon:yes gene_type:complete